jgi:hypothetical protein
MTEPLTVIFFSCRRVEMLRETTQSFLQYNKYPYAEFIIVNDSADPKIHQQVKVVCGNIPKVRFIFNEQNVGLMKSIDLGYSQVKTNYIFHAEDDWKLIAPNFVEQSMRLMMACPYIEEVWPRLYNIHDAEPRTFDGGSVKYKLVTEFHLQGQDGLYGWHGISTAFGVKRISDYLKVAPYSTVMYSGNIWMREQAIGEEYRKLGYRVAILANGEYAVNIGYGKSEYKVHTESDGRKDK